MRPDAGTTPHLAAVKVALGGGARHPGDDRQDLAAERRDAGAQRVGLVPGQQEGDGHHGGADEDTCHYCLTNNARRAM